MKLINGDEEVKKQLIVAFGLCGDRMSLAYSPKPA
jgi:hypothetical protein